MRMSYAWKRAVRAIAVTSSTTAVAFLANAFSPLMPIKSFGIYAAIIIPSNYLLVIMLFPSAIIFYDKHFDKYVFCCCFCGKLKEAKKYSADTNRPSAAISNDQGKITNTHVSDQKTITEEHRLEMESDVPELGQIEKFFGGKWNYWVYKTRYVIIFIMLGWTIFAITKAKDIGPLTEKEEFLPADHQISIVRDTLKEKFSSANENPIKVTIFWGVKELIKDDVGLWDATDMGKVVMDDKFTLSTVDAQNDILKFCDDLQK